MSKTSGGPKSREPQLSDEPPSSASRSRRRTRPFKTALARVTRQAGAPQPLGQPGVRYLGCDVHAATITVAIAEPTGEVHLYGTISTTAEAVRKLLTKLGADGVPLAVVYEAGPCGYWLWRLITTLGIPCTVIAPNLIPRAASARVKTDTRDALQLARLARLGELIAVWVPEARDEALRDLIRAREDAAGDRTRARHRLSKFLLRHGVGRPAGVQAWTDRHHHWLCHHVEREPAFAHAAAKLTLHEYVTEIHRLTERIERYEAAITRLVETELAPERRAVIHALQTLRGVRLLTAATIISEVGQLSRFRRPAQLMSYAGIVLREHSSGASRRQGAITKTGNAHLRRVLIQSAWAYRHTPKLSAALRRRQVGQPAPVQALAWAAQLRLTDRYRALLRQHKALPQVITAIGRELLGFIWAIGVEVEQAQQQQAEVA